MEWRYLLYDRAGNCFHIDEPIGFDAFSLKIKRHVDRHGTFREVQTNQFQFIGKGAEILRDEYELYGIRGKCEIEIKGRCGKSFLTLYRGKVDFGPYVFKCDNGNCYVTVQLDQIGALVDFINRFDQKVDVTSLTAFDGATSLTDYSEMVHQILLPSKAIKLRGISTNTDVAEYILSDDTGWIAAFPDGTGTFNGAVSVPFQSTEVNAIKDYLPESLMDLFNNSQLQEYIPEIIYNNPEQSLHCSGTQFTLNFRVKGIWKHLYSTSGSFTFKLVLKRGPGNFVATDAVVIQSWTLASNTFSGSLGTGSVPFDHSYSDTINLQPGEKLWLDFFLVYTKTSNETPNVRLQVDPETKFSVEVTSKCDPTTAKLFMINETVSRTIESITNNQLKVYSEYYGRTESQPYSFAHDGCGGRRALSTGLFIRNAKMADGSDPKFFLSMKDIFESLSAIDNIGIGTEGSNIRIENWKYFYKDAVIYTCLNIDTVEKVTKSGEHISVFKNGYDKWEAEDYNGLDEFLTKREWRTALTEVQNTLEKICRFIGSGYAWEVTRRKQNDTKDWRFDNNTFILCLSNSYIGDLIFGTNTVQLTTDIAANWQFGDIINIETIGGVNNHAYTVMSVTSGGGYVVLTLGGTGVITPGSFIGTVWNYMRQWVEVNNIGSAANFLDPPTVLNFGISPARNAMRWFDRVAACYRNITNADKLIFSSGDGNFLAEGKLIDPCVLEGAVIKENDDIVLASFADPDNAKPIAFPERVVFTYPLGFSDYRRIADNPEGVIIYQSACETGEGWIDELEYFPEQGKAKFTLIPKILT